MKNGTHNTTDDKMPTLRYIFTRQGMIDIAFASSLAAACFVASYFLVRANVF